MKNYELLLIISGKVAESDVPATIVEIKKIFTKNDAKILDEAIWGTMKLAYEIKHQRTGTYVLWHLSVEPANVGGLNGDLQVADNVLRFLLIDQPTHGKTIDPPNKRVEEKEGMGPEKSNKGTDKSGASVKKEKMSTESTGSTKEAAIVNTPVKEAESAKKPASSGDLDTKLDEILKEQI